jgi:rhamnose transport system ATP-binding protein
VHQHLSLVPTMSVEENCSLSRLPTRAGFVDRKRVREAALAAMEKVHLSIDPRKMVDELSFAERQMLEIGRSLLVEPRVLILDEPTSALTPGETDRLFELLHRLNSEEGTALLYVSHRIGEIYALTERATVLRDGEMVAQLELAAHPSHDLVTAMVGREIDLVTRRERVSTSETYAVRVLEVERLTGRGFFGVDLAVDQGEICAVAGLVGAGRTELVRHVFGLERPSTGCVRVDGTELRSGSVSAALKAGIGFVPEDRHLDGLALDLSSGENAIAPSLDRVYRGGILRSRKRRSLIEEVLVGGDVRPPDPARSAASLSGGNQQKIVIGKWLARDLRVLILDEPTAGVDVEAKNQIHRRIRELADEGLTVVLVSSDLPEVLTLADRIVVMREGRVVGEVTQRDDWTEERVIELATGEHDSHLIEVV